MTRQRLPGLKFGYAHDERAPTPARRRRDRLGATRGLRLTVVLLAAAIGGCGSESGAGGGNPGASSATAGSAEGGETVAITPEARQEAQQIFGTRCSVCHGAEGRGDGPGGAALVPTPRNFHDTAWQDSVADKEIETAIVSGGAAVGRSPAMVANPDLRSKPGVVAALREIIRNFGKQQ